jgi:hypothetical protein
MMIDYVGYIRKLELYKFSVKVIITCYELLHTLLPSFSFCFYIFVYQISVSL